MEHETSKRPLTTADPAFVHFALALSLYHSLRSLADQTAPAESDAPDPKAVNISGSLHHAARLVAMALDTMTAELFPQPQTLENVN